MSAASTTSTTKKPTTKATPNLPKDIFEVEVKNHELLKLAYTAYLAESRSAGAKTLTRGLVRGGGKKPWRQKGTGRARVGSTRSPIWRSGGITFGPTGNENHKISISTKQRRQALRQALTLASQSGRVQTVDAFTAMDGKTKDMAAYLKSVDATRSVLCVVDQKDHAKERATQNIPYLKVTGAMHLTTFDVLTADKIIISSKALEVLSERLKKEVKA